MSLPTPMFLFLGILVPAVAGTLISISVVEIEDQNNEKRLISPEVGLYYLLEGMLPTNTRGSFKAESLKPEILDKLSHEQKNKVGQNISSKIDVLPIDTLYKYEGEGGLAIARPVDNYGNFDDSEVGILKISFTSNKKQKPTHMHIPFPKSKLTKIASATLKQKPDKTVTVTVFDNQYEYYYGSSLDHLQTTKKVVDGETYADLNYLNNIYEQTKIRIESNGDSCKPDNDNTLWDTD